MHWLIQFRQPSWISKRPPTNTGFQYIFGVPHGNQEISRGCSLYIIAHMGDKHGAHNDIVSQLTTWSLDHNHMTTATTTWPQPHDHLTTITWPQPQPHGYLTTWPHDQLITWPLDHMVTWPHGHLTTWYHVNITSCTINIPYLVHHFLQGVDRAPYPYSSVIVHRHRSVVYWKIFVCMVTVVHTSVVVVDLV